MMDSLILDYGGALDYGIPAGTYYSDPAGEIATLTAKLEEADRRSEYWKAEHLAGNEVIAEQAAQIESLEKDAARLDWFERMFVHSWNGVIGTGSLTHWVLAGDYRHQVAKMQGRLFRAAIDAAILGDSHVR